MRIFETCALTKEEIILIISKEKEINFKTYTLTHKEENFLVNTLNIVLKSIGIEYLYDYLLYCFKEIISNAKRANVKRLFFIQNGLDINDPVDYERGMRNFKKEYNDKKDFFDGKLSESDFFLLIKFQIVDDTFTIEISNNAALTDKENESITSNINSAKHFNSFEEALTIVTKESEGAGLGYIIIILMLKKIGLSKENLIISREKRETKAVIQIPMTLINVEQNQIISSLIINEINNLPKFPEHILNLQKKIDNPEISMNEIVKDVSNDPSLVADLLKAANSPLYMFPGQISSVMQAVKLIGLRELKNIFFSFGTYHILNNRYDPDKMKNIWLHSQKVAFFSMMLAKKFLSKEYLEDAYVGGLLHDIGKILLLGINSKLILKLRDICMKKEIPVRILEDITSGYNHAVIGSMIAEKWNFPHKYVSVIKYHNKPITDENNILIYCIYLANLMTHEGNRQNFFNTMNKSTQNLFKINTYEDFEKLIIELNEKYKNFEKESFF